MPVCPVSLSEERRGRLGSALLLLHLATAALAQVLYLLLLYLKQQLEDRSLLLQDYQPQNLFDLMQAGVITLVAFHLPSAKICLDVGDQATRRRWHACFYVWLLGAVGVSIFTLVQMTELITHRGRIDTAFLEGFRSAMERYGDDAVIKTAVDRIQLEGQCCGFSIYRDWFRVPWADPEEVADLRVFIGDKHMKDGLWMVPWAPWSCCNASRLGPCDTLLMQVPRLMGKKKQKNIERRIGEEMARLGVEKRPREYRDADGHVRSAEAVLQILEQQQFKVRMKRSPADRHQDASGEYSSDHILRVRGAKGVVKKSDKHFSESSKQHKSNKNHTTDDDNTTTVHQGKAPSAYGVELEKYIGTDFFKDIVPDTVSLPTQLFVTVPNISRRQEQVARQQQQFYSPPQRGAVREKQLNQRGCVEHLSDDVWALLGACYAVYMLVWLLQVAILIGARWLQTSVDLARRWGADHLTAPGYLLFSWPWTLGEGLELQPPPEDPEAIFHMNDLEEDIMAGLGLDKVQRMVNVAQGLTSGNAMEALNAVKDTGILEGTRMGQAVSLLGTLGAGSGGGGGDGDDDSGGGGDNDHDDDSDDDKKDKKHKNKKAKKEKKSKKKKGKDKKSKKKSKKKKKSKSKSKKKKKSKRKNKKRSKGRKGKRSSGKRRRKK